VDTDVRTSADLSTSTDARQGIDGR
jgi:hypothetical protein